MDIVFSIRFGLNDTKRNKKFIQTFANWLSKNYSDLAFSFLSELKTSAKIPFEGSMTTVSSHTLEIDDLINIRHPFLISNKWILDGIEMMNKKPVWIKLENQWIKAKIAIKGKEKNILIEPENVVIPIAETLFLKW